MSPQKSASSAQLAGAMFLCVFLLALTGLFGIWYSHERADTSLESLSTLSRLIVASRQAQVDFKIQVQNWKNLLLRGQDASEFDEYSRRFAEQDQKVRDSLASMRDSAALPPQLKPEVEAIAADHATLLAKYQAAAKGYSPTDPRTIFAVDKSVRGIDQKLNGRIDEVARQLTELETARLEEAKASGKNLYQGMRIAVIAVSAMAIGCAGVLAWRSIRKVN